MEQIEKQKVVELNPENRRALQEMLSLSVQSQEDCAVCLETLHNPVITPCAHAFGRECIEKVIETQNKCPMCRSELKDSSILVQPANDFGDEAKDDSIDLDASSTKLEALIELLNASKSTGNKTVVFSQWVG
jgi:SWI/SNF-related matrix-associated actin-dependent regulator of chromatin subfamily A3